LALWAATVATIAVPLLRENGEVVRAVIATVHCRAAITAAVDPSQEASPAKLPSDVAKSMRYASTAEPRALGVAGQVTTTLAPEFEAVAGCSWAGTADADIVEMLDQLPDPCRFVARYLNR
jgi:hypothetical protein